MTGQLVSPFPSIFTDLEAAALQRGLRDLLNGGAERFTHAYVAATPLGPRSEHWDITLLQVGKAEHFIAVPAQLADAAAFAAPLGRALREAVAARSRAERRFVVADDDGEPQHVRVAPVRVGRRMHLIAIPDDRDPTAPSPAAQRLLFAQEEERHRIAIELHDSTSQHLVAVSLGLARLRRVARAGRAERRALDDMSHALAGALGEIRTFSYLMNPPQLERDGLKATVRRFASGFETRTGMQTRLAITGEPDAAGVAVQHTLFRVLQEALTSLYRQTRDARVRIALARRGGWITLTVADDRPAGPGGEERLLRAPIGVGIAGMHAPVVQLGGSLRVTHGAAGVQVVARLPTGAGAAVRAETHPRPVRRRVRVGDPARRSQGST